MTRLRIGILLVALALLAPATASAKPLKVPWTFDGAAYAQFRDPNGSPPGSNDFSCTPSAAHPNPVVLVHGTFANQQVNWQTISPYLANRGFCVFSLTYGRVPGIGFGDYYHVGGMARIEQSAQELKDFVEVVLAATGASEVDLVGHSQGTLMPDYYVKYLGGAAEVDDYIGLATLWNGTDPAGLGKLSRMGEPYGFSQPFYALIDSFCPACRQMLSGSDFLNHLRDGGVTVPGVDYTNIVTAYDELVAPYTSGILPAAPNVTNVVVQRKCPLDFAEHLALVADPVAAGFLYQALDPSAPKPPCTLVLPAIGAVGYHSN